MSSIEKQVERLQKEQYKQQVRDAWDTYKDVRVILDNVVSEVLKAQNTDAALSVVVLSLEVKALAQQVLERRKRIDG